MGWGAGTGWDYFNLHIPFHPSLEQKWERLLSNCHFCLFPTVRERNYHNPQNRIFNNEKILLFQSLKLLNFESVLGKKCSCPPNAIPFNTFKG